MNISPALLSATNNLVQTNCVNRITININNTQSRNTLHHGKHTLKAGNKLITPLPVTINRRETGSINSKSIIEKACGIVTYEIDSKRKNNLPLLLIIGWKISIIGENKWFVFVGCETDPNFPDESSINKYLEKNGNKGSNTLEFEEYSMIIDGSISDGNNAQLNIDIRSRGVLGRLFGKISKRRYI